MIFNYRLLDNGDAAINVFPVHDSNYFTRTSRKHWCAYYFQGLAYKMIICPSSSVTDELLLQRPGLYLKTNLPLGAVVFLRPLPGNYLDHSFNDELAWMVDSYLFKFNATRPFSHATPMPQYYVDYANGIPTHGEFIYDHAHIRAAQEVSQHIGILNLRYSQDLTNFVTSQPDRISITNYAETSLLQEVCSHREFFEESHRYVVAIESDNPELLAASKLTHGYENIICSKKYNRVVLSFYLAAMKEPIPNSPGSYIGMFKNLYNVPEYLMAGEGCSSLQQVLQDRVRTDRLQALVRDIKTTANPGSVLLGHLTQPRQVTPNLIIPPLSESDPDIAGNIAKRLYYTRNAVLHSKKTFRGAPQEHNVRPGPDESSRLCLDLTIIRHIAGVIVEELDPDE